MPLTKPITEHPHYAQFESCSDGARLLYHQLRDHADHYALILDDPCILKSKCCPRSRLRHSELSSFVEELCKAGLCRRDHDQHGRPILHLPGCEQTAMKRMKSEHIPPKEYGQMFLGAPHKEQKERKKEQCAREPESKPENKTVTPLASLRLGLNEIYRRGETDAWSYAEEYELKVVSQRPAALAELEQIKQFRRSLPADERKKFFPQSIHSLISKWTENLDKSRVQSPLKTVRTKVTRAAANPPTTNTAAPDENMLRQGIAYLEKHRPNSPMLAVQRKALAAILNRDNE